MDKDRRRRIWLRVAAVILLLVGLALIFNEQLKSIAISHMQNKVETTQIAKKQPSKGNFDFKSVKEVDNRAVVRASMDKQKAIGKLAIPAIKMKLPIFYGLDNSNLVRGAGTMKQDEKMGEVGNYALAGHHMKNPNILFGPLSKTKPGQKVYLTDGKKVYCYQIIKKTRVNESQVQWVDDVPGQRLLTLITCASGTEGETNRIIVRGKLIQVQPASSRNMKYFD